MAAGAWPGRLTDRLGQWCSACRGTAERDAGRRASCPGLGGACAATRASAGIAGTGHGRRGAADPDRLPEAAVWRLHGGRAANRFRVLAPRMARLLSQGRGVLVIAPEHATLRRAWEGLSGLAQASDTRAVQVSGQLGDAQREHAWALVRSGSARLVIGSYLALSAP
ncbi:hypothetical protein ACFSC4_13180 [Deinococcus malanensis]|uniref:hypothetical protein n=1 Tax=Deinococcus malanensis TaxID=1706855 RepID=UPI00362675CD